MSDNPAALRVAAHPGGVDRPSSDSLADLLERVLDKGIVIAGDVSVRLVDVELLTIKLRLLITSVDKAREIGVNWWESDPWLSGRAGEERGDHPLGRGEDRGRSPLGRGEDRGRSPQGRGESSGRQHGADDHLVERLERLEQAVNSVRSALGTSGGALPEKGRS